MGIFWNFRIFCLCYVETHLHIFCLIIHKYLRSTHFKPEFAVFASLFASLGLTSVILSCPFPICWAFHFIGNFSCKQVQLLFSFFFLLCFLSYFLLFFIQLSSVPFVLQMFLAFILCLSFVSPLSCFFLVCLSTLLSIFSLTWKKGRRTITFSLSLNTGK